ncbi:MAG: hypothetical protein JST59_02335 [Actinobacteria bacterium]|nr:hypothetical protein [Actinomycetota bacterium]
MKGELKDKEGATDTGKKKEKKKKESTEVPGTSTPTVEGTPSTSPTKTEKVELDPLYAEKLRKMMKVTEEEEEEEVVMSKEGSILTLADQQNDRKSLNRKVTERLYLIVKKDRNDHSWGFPEALYDPAEDGSSLRKVVCNQDSSK